MFLGTRGIFGTPRGRQKGAKNQKIILSCCVIDMLGVRSCLIIHPELEFRVTFRFPCTRGIFGTPRGRQKGFGVSGAFLAKIRGTQRGQKMPLVHGNPKITLNSCPGRIIKQL